MRGYADAISGSLPLCRGDKSKRWLASRGAAERNRPTIEQAERRFFGQPAHEMDLGETIVSNSGDTAWIITATGLVLLMTLPALALFYGGLVQAKNILSVLVQCFAIACVASVLWFGIGYSLAFRFVVRLPSS